MATYEYMEVRRRPWNQGELMYRRNIGHLSKAGREALGRELDQRYPSSEFCACEVGTKQEREEVLPEMNTSN
jgi:hypothetical protein